MKHLVEIIFVVSILFSCSSSNNQEKDSLDKRAFLKEGRQVKAVIIKKDTFNNEIISTGKLMSLRKSDLKFKVGGVVDKIFVKNGSFVNLGDTIAKLNGYEQSLKYRRAQLAMDQAIIELRNHLLGQGFTLEDSATVPYNFMKIAKVRSGYSVALNELELAKLEKESTNLIALFPGRIANINKHRYEEVGIDALCSLIDDSSFEVEFSVLETEIDKISINQSIKVTTFSSNRPFGGYITEINPVVGDNGLIKVKALTKNSGGLMEGMNVRVLIENGIEDQFIIPKSAVLQRDNRKILFKYINGVAWWTYIKVVLENSDSYAVIGDADKSGILNEGDTIIVSGNMNLAHESKVDVKW